MEMHLEKYNLKDKVAIVTGGSSGIGYAIAVEMAKHGADIIIADLVREENILSEIGKLGRRAMFVKADVSRRDEVDEVTKGAMDQFGEIDILVNSAGILSRYNFMEMKEDDWDRMMNINLKGVYFCCQSVAPHMMKQRSGRIVNMGSASSRGPMLNIPQGGPDYCISKAGVHTLTRTLAWELAPYGINVNCVAPCAVETPMHHGHLDRVREKYRDKIPLGRLAKPEDIANVVTFLVTEAASFITGQAIHVNGGLIMVD